jgi:hypothetical protein
MKTFKFKVATFPLESEKNVYMTTGFEDSSCRPHQLRVKLC